MKKNLEAILLLSIYFIGVGSAKILKLMSNKNHYQPMSGWYVEGKRKKGNEVNELSSPY